MGHGELAYFNKPKEILGYRNRIITMAKESIAGEITAIEPKLMDDREKKELIDIANSTLDNPNYINILLPNWKNALKDSTKDAEEIEAGIAKALAKRLVREVQEEPLQKAA